MKILMINMFPLTGSGSGVYAVNMANALVRKGHEVCCIFPDNIPSNSADYQFKTHPIYFAQDDGTKPEVEETVLPFNFPCFSTHPRSTFNFTKITDQQIKDYKQAFREAISDEIAKFKPDVIHSGHIWSPSAVATEFNLPLIITCHGTDIFGYDDEYGDRYRADAHKAVDVAKAIVCISQQNIDEMLRCFPDAKDKAILMPNGYDAQTFYPEIHERAEILADYGIDKSYQYLVSFAGKFAHFKGIDILLKAAKQYSDGSVATVVAGDGTLFDEMTALKNELQLDDVYFVHNQPHDKLRRLYSAADVSLVPSRGEAFGLVVIEAGACGAPVIGTNDGGITGILTPETGILIDPEDPDTLAREVKAVLSGKKKFDRTHIAKYTKDTFSQDSLIDKTVELYQKVC